MIPGWLESEVRAYETPVEREPEVVLDIGANVGAFTLLALKKWPSCRVFAYEPNPEAAKEWRENVTSDRATLFEVAVGKESGTALLKLGDNIATASLHDIGRQTDEEVQVITLAAKALPAAQCIKIDTEGSEVEILQSLDLSQCETLAVEWHRKLDHAPIQWLAQDAGLHLHESNQADANTGILKFTRRIIKGRLFVGIPSYNGVNGHFMACLLKLQQDQTVNRLMKIRSGDSLVSRSRDEITDAFMRSNCDALLFIDTDIIFSAEHVQRIAAHPEEVVGGCYPKKQKELAYVLNALPCEDKPNERGLQKVRYIGTGFIRVRREVFDRMIEKWGSEILYHPDDAQNRTAYDFWSVGVYPGMKRYLSEDWYFCQRCLDLGLDVWADTRISLKHVGEAVYPL